jgi:hypothetical protein
MNNSENRQINYTYFTSAECWTKQFVYFFQNAFLILYIYMNLEICSLFHSSLTFAECFQEYFGMKVYE